MMKRLLSIVSVLILCSIIRAEIITDIPCGSWLTIKALPVEDYVFVKWSDGDTTAVRSIQVDENATFIAYFAAKCEEYANWPIVALYDWLIMIDVQAITAQGYYVSPSNVTWYRVVGEPDDMHYDFPQDDQVVVQGSYYMTQAQNLRGSGQYYAVVDVSDAQGKLCDGLMRSMIVNFSGTHKAPSVFLTPNVVHPGQIINLKGLIPDEKTEIIIFDVSGRIIRTLTTFDMTLQIQAETIAGCYYVHVVSPMYNQVLKYLVQN